ncbi:zinc finger protein [Trema orientale]|uniref:Zinc finger protein n=1 Tax=Trema orientale TaxID=63057 RepID=A0A2P5FKU9_TREOI|nr:zinc finger protein [Trema orientale]
MAFQVRCFHDGQYIVNLNKGQCTCRKWNISGIPCSHSIACINDRNLDIYKYVNHWFHRDKYEKAYAPVVYGINGPELWKKIVHIPMEAPPFKVQCGRPKKLRRKEPDEYQLQNTTTKLKKTCVVIRCSNCGQARHNVKTCPYPRKEKAPTYVPIVSQTNTLHEPAEGPKSCCFRIQFSTKA